MPGVLHLCVDLIDLHEIIDEVEGDKVWYQAGEKKLGQVTLLIAFYF